MKVLPLEEIVKYKGVELSVSDWFEIDQDRVDRFADATCDKQWIHVDKAMAERGPYGKTIAHGFLVLSLVTHLSGGQGLIPEGATMIINYGLNRVRFPGPVPVGSRIRNRMVLTDVVQRQDNRVLMTATNNIEVQGQSKPACVAETLGMFFIESA